MLVFPLLYFIINFDFTFFPFFFFFFCFCFLILKILQANTLIKTAVFFLFRTLLPSISGALTLPLIFVVLISFFIK